MTPMFFVFDVESIGLHGDGFAVGLVVISRAGSVHEELCYACPQGAASGSRESRDWVSANVPAIPITHDTPIGVRDAFWHRWKAWRDKGAILVADCAWPVEARFLARCVDDNPKAREWEGPYPLHDLASVLLAAGQDPLAKHIRLPKELPEHHPLNDARQSARLLIQTLNQHGAR